MSYLDAIILGLIQGLTEFLPVSSSGHLVLVQAILDVKEPGVSFEVLVHLGTLLAVLVYFRSSITRLLKSITDGKMKRERAMLGFLVIGTIPAGVVGLLFKGFLENAFSDPVMAAAMLFVTGLILLSTRFVRKGKKNVSVGSVVIMGIGQALAILPGISRSGTTIASGMLAGVRPSEAAEFSFLLAIPAIGGAAILESKELLSLSPELVGQYLLGSAIAFLVALVAVHIVLATIRRGVFEYFAYYCFAAGALGLYLFH